MKVPPLIYYSAVFFSIFAAFGSYFFEVTASFLLLIFIFRLFWRENTPPVIITGLFFQWLSVSVGYIYLSVSSFTISDLLWRPDFSLSEINSAFWSGIFGLFFFSLGLKIPVRNLRPLKIPDSLIKKYNVSKIIIFYLLFTFFSDILNKAIRFTVPGLSQLTAMLLFFKWSLLFILIFISFRKKEKTSVVLIILLIEIIIGFTGYFSAFKDILIIIFIIWLSFNRIKRTKQVVFIAVFLFFIFNIGAVWSYVKVDYRMFLSGGERAQVVKVSKTDALKELINLTSKINAQTYKIGIKNMIKRIFFLEYFSATIKHIPYEKPHTDGQNIGAAVKHVLMPRFLFPNKESIDDSKQTMKLTGIRLADAQQGTSISVGYMAELYADFGSYFMMIPVFFLGFLSGIFYKYFFTIQKNPVWAYALIIPLYFFINIFGKNLVKITGNIFWFFLVFNLVVFFLIPPVDKFFRKTKTIKK